MTEATRRGWAHEGVPTGDPIVEVTVRLFARPGAKGQSISVLLDDLEGSTTVDFQ